MTKDKDTLKRQAELLEATIETATVDSNGLVEDESRLDDLYYELALIEEQLDIVNKNVELLDESFDDLDDNDFKLLRGDIDEND